MGGAVGACGRWHVGLRWGSLWGHETYEGRAKMGAVGASKHWRVGLRWSSLRGHETRETTTKPRIR
eukprot:936631-Pyramimonas_sp.AAC.1